MEPPCLPRDLISVSAFICQQIIQDQDKLFSAIRILDTITARVKTPSDEPLVDLFAFVVAKSSATEPFQRQIVVELVSPSGERKLIGTNVLPFGFDIPEGPMSATLVLQFTLPIRTAGLYWLDVLFEGEKLASIPLALRIEIVPAR